MGECGIWQKVETGSFPRIYQELRDRGFCNPIIRYRNWCRSTHDRGSWVDLQCSSLEIRTWIYIQFSLVWFDGYFKRKNQRYPFHQQSPCCGSSHVYVLTTIQHTRYISTDKGESIKNTSYAFSFYQLIRENGAIRENLSKRKHTFYKYEAHR